MFVIRGGIEIARPAEDVFAYLADFEHDREWRSEVTEATPLTAERAGCGVRYLEAMHFPGFSLRSEFEVTECDPPRLLTAEGRSAGMHASQRYELTPRDGRTRLDVTTRIDASGVLAMGDVFVSRLLNGRARENLRRLKRVLESEASG